MQYMRVGVFCHNRITAGTDMLTETEIYISGLERYYVFGEINCSELTEFRSLHDTSFS